MIESLEQPQSLPHSEESERAVLGGVLLDPTRFPTLSARSLQRWGADLLDPRGKRILIGSGQGFLYAPTQTTSFGED